MEQNVPLYDLESVGCTAQHSGALAALRLLRSYNHFLVPPDVHGVVPLLATLPQSPCLPPYCQHLPPRTAPLNALARLPSKPECSTITADTLLMTGLSPSVLSPASGSGEAEVRRRGEKRPIPAELKDEKYFERRRRNNQAAKKSRDARRVREDQIAWRACFLEQENASLRAHVAALRQEALTLRAMLARSPAEVPQAAHHAPSSTTTD